MKNTLAPGDGSPDHVSWMRQPRRIAQYEIEQQCESDQGCREMKRVRHSVRKKQRALPENPNTAVMSWALGRAVYPSERRYPRERSGKGEAPRGCFAFARRRNSLEIASLRPPGRIRTPGSKTNREQVTGTICVPPPRVPALGYNLPARPDRSIHPPPYASRSTDERPCPGAQRSPGNRCPYPSQVCPTACSRPWHFEPPRPVLRWQSAPPPPSRSLEKAH